MMNYVKTVFQKYAEFNGRARRSEYWYFFLFNFLVSIVLNVVDVSAGMTFGPEGTSGILSTIYSLGVIVPSIAVAVRRMHDVGKSGWFILIPIYNLILACTNGETGSNQYGKDPKNPDSSDDIAQHLVN